jgi:hypothetical protein
MTDLTTFTSLTGIALMAACWRQLLAFVQRIRSFIVLRITVQGDDARAIAMYCFRHFRRSPFGDRWFQTGNSYIRPLNRMQAVLSEKPPRQPLIFFDGWKPILLGSEFHQSSPGIESGMVSISMVRLLTNADDLLCAAMKEFNALQSTAETGCRRYYVQRVAGVRRDYSNRQSAAETAPAPLGGRHRGEGVQPGDRVLGWSPDDLGPPILKKPLESVAIPPELEDAIEEFRRWKDSEAWYRERQIPWRRGWVLKGKPGTGKTLLVRTIAQEFDLPVWSYDLGTLSNEEMYAQWRNMQESAPCIALMEDIDGVFHGRENVLGDQGGGLTFDCLLNTLGGIETCDGIFTIITTNHPEHLDPALAVDADGIPSRPGRIDRIIEVPSLGPAQREHIARRICGDWPDLIPAIIQDTEGFTGAQVTERCVNEALSRYWGQASVVIGNKTFTVPHPTTALSRT